jgi:hypothetical protein
MTWCDYRDAEADRFRQLEQWLDDANATLELVFVHSWIGALSKHANRVLEDLCARWNDTSDVVSYRFLRQDDIHRLVAGDPGTEAINLDVVLYDWGVQAEPYVAYYGQVSAEDVGAWLATHGSALFSRNIRQLIPDSDVNQSIVQSLLAKPEHFWYLNNGITVLCDRILKAPIGGNLRKFGQFTCEGVSIVNGAQTVGSVSIAAREDPEAVKSARVAVRFISLEHCPPEFPAAVTRATNTQNRIDSRDFVALDPEQERLRRDLHLEAQRIYTYKTGEPDPPPELGCSVVEATVALACAARDPALAIQAKREIGRLWSDIKKPPYTQVFNQSVAALKLWRAVLVMRDVETILKVEQRRRDGRARAVAVHGNRLILHLVFRALPVDEFSDPDFGFESVAQRVGPITADVMDRLTSLIDELFPKNYVASLFKNASKTKELAQAFG